MNEEKVSNLILYLAKYFVIIFCALIFLDLLRSIKITESSIIFRYSILTLFIFVSFFVSYIIIAFYNKNLFTPWKSIINSILDITFIVPVYLIITNKRKYEKVLDLEKVFLIGFSIFIFMFLSFSLFSYIAYSIPGLLNSIVGVNILNREITPYSINAYQSLIIVDNLVFLAEILLGSFFLLLPSFMGMTIDNLVLSPIFISPLLRGFVNIILPQLILELLGTAVAAGTSFTIFYTFFISINRKSKSIKYKRLVSYSRKLIVFGIILSVYAFLVGWIIESSLISSNGFSRFFYNSIYLYDTITIIIYSSFLYSILHKKYFPLQQLVLPSLAAGAVLFDILGDLKAQLDISYIFLFSFFAIAYSMLEIRRYFFIIFPGIKQFKELNKSLEKYNCSIFKVDGRSMKPVITKNDYLINYNINDNFNFKIGDIITFEPPIYYNAIPEARFVTHRIYKINGIGIITKGDNLRKIDPTHTELYNIYGLALGKFDNNMITFESITDRPEFDATIKNIENVIGKYNKINKIYMKSESVYFTIFNILIIIIPSILIPSLFLL